MVHKVRTDDSHFRGKKKNKVFSFQMQYCYTGTEGVPLLTKIKFREMTEAKKGFAAGQK